MKRIPDVKDFVESYLALHKPEKECPKWAVGLTTERGLGSYDSWQFFDSKKDALFVYRRLEKLLCAVVHDVEDELKNVETRP